MDARVAREQLSRRPRSLTPADSPRSTLFRPSRPNSESSAPSGHHGHEQCGAASFCPRYLGERLQCALHRDAHEAVAALCMRVAAARRPKRAAHAAGDAAAIPAPRSRSAPDAVIALLRAACKAHWTMLLEDAVTRGHRDIRDDLGSLAMHGHWALPGHVQSRTWSRATTRGVLEDVGGALRPAHGGFVDDDRRVEFPG